MFRFSFSVPAASVIIRHVKCVDLLEINVKTIAKIEYKMRKQEKKRMMEITGPTN